MSDEQMQHLNDLLRQYERRLRILEQQAATFGSSASPATIIEIEDLVSKISKIHYQIDQLRYEKQEPKSNEPEYSLSIVILSAFEKREHYLFGTRISQRISKSFW